MTRYGASNVQIGCCLRSELNWTWVGGMSSPPSNKSCNRAGLFKRPVHSSASSRWPQALVQNRKQLRLRSFSWQPGHPVAARDSPRRMNLAVVPSATSSHRARTPGRPVRAILGHATSRARTHSAHFTACRATLFYAPISLDLTRSRQVAPPSRSKPALNSRSVSMGVFHKIGKSRHSD